MNHKKKIKKKDENHEDGGSMKTGGCVPADSRVLLTALHLLLLYFRSTAAQVNTDHLGNNTHLNHGKQRREG